MLPAVNKTLSSSSKYIIIAIFKKFTCKQRRKQYTYKATENRTVRSI